MAVDPEAVAVVVSTRVGACTGVRAEFVGDFFSVFWFSGDFVMAGDVILQKQKKKMVIIFGAVAPDGSSIVMLIGKYSEMPINIIFCTIAQL